MNERETAELLTLAALIDSRTVTDETVLLWTELLADVPYDLAVQAMHAHYRESSAWLMPAHVRDRVDAATQEGEDWWRRWRDYGITDEAFHELGGRVGQREAMRRIEQAGGMPELES